MRIPLTRAAVESSGRSRRRLGSPQPAERQVRNGQGRRRFILFDQPPVGVIYFGLSPKNVEVQELRKEKGVERFDENSPSQIDT